MTPEQENELVARWMGWELLEGLWQKSNALGWVVDLKYDLPNYRTDPALLWELMDRLMSAPHWWTFEKYGDPQNTCEGVNFDDDCVVMDTLAEAVFAAAVMQAEQEGK